MSSARRSCVGDESVFLLDRAAKSAEPLGIERGREMPDRLGDIRARREARHDMAVGTVDPPRRPGAAERADGFLDLEIGGIDGSGGLDGHPGQPTLSGWRTRRR